MITHNWTGWSTEKNLTSNGRQFEADWSFYDEGWLKHLRWAVLAQIDFRILATWVPMRGNFQSWEAASTGFNKQLSRTFTGSAYAGPFQCRESGFKMLTGRTVRGRIVWGRKLSGKNYPRKKIVRGRIIRGKNCPEEELSRGRIIRGKNFPGKNYPWNDLTAEES